MPKAASRNTTPTLDLDAKLHAMIARCAALWRKDEARKSPGIGAARLEAYRLEGEIAAAAVFTRSGYRAKCATIDEHQWDLDDLVTIAFLLGKDAQRLNINTIPAFLQNREGEMWPGLMTQRVRNFVQAYNEMVEANLASLVAA